MPEPRPIYTYTDTAFECPECGRRLNFGDPVGRDEDGDIYEGVCLIHGAFLVQAVDEPDDDDEEAICAPTVQRTQHTCGQR